MTQRKAGNPEEPRFDGVLGVSSEIGLPLVRNLSQEYRDRPEPEDSDRVPPPAPRGLMTRILDRLRGRNPAR